MTEPMKEKNSERLEIRLPYSKKLAFMDACENQSDTPSHAIRRFINSYIVRADRDEIGHFVGIIKRRFFPVSALAVFIFAVSLFAYWNNNGADSLGVANEHLFSNYDKNLTGQIEKGEIALGSNETHLFQVLDKNGDDLISEIEFIPEGEIAWAYKEKDPEFGEDGESMSFEPTGSLYFVQFDLTDVEDPFISVWMNNPEIEEISIRADQIIIKPLPN